MAGSAGTAVNAIQNAMARSLQKTSHHAHPRQVPVAEALINGTAGGSVGRPWAPLVPQPISYQTKKRPDSSCVTCWLTSPSPDRSSPAVSSWCTGGLFLWLINPNRDARFRRKPGQQGDREMAALDGRRRHPAELPALRAMGRFSRRVAATDSGVAPDRADHSQQAPLRSLQARRVHTPEAFVRFP